MLPIRWCSWSTKTSGRLGRPEDQKIVREAAVEAGKQEIVIARKGLNEPGQPLLKEIAALGVTVTPSCRQPSASVRLQATRPVYNKWKAQIGNDLVTKAEKAIAARKQ